MQGSANKLMRRRIETPSDQCTTSHAAPAQRRKGCTSISLIAVTSYVAMKTLSVDSHNQLRRSSGTGIVWAWRAENLGNDLGRGSRMDASAFVEKVRGSRPGCL